MKKQVKLGNPMRKVPKGKHLFLSVVEELCHGAGFGHSWVRAGRRGRGWRQTVTGLRICRGKKYIKRLEGDVV